MFKIIIASDHAGFALKQSLIEHLEQRDCECRDLGTDSTDPADYPDYAHAVAEEVKDGEIGILICGTGIGMSIAANRHSTIRCAVAVTPRMAELARQHNNANILALGARLIDEEHAKRIVDIFLDTDYAGGRHDARIAKIDLNVGFDSGQQ